MCYRKFGHVNVIKQTQQKRPLFFEDAADRDDPGSYRGWEQTWFDDARSSGLNQYPGGGWRFSPSSVALVERYCWGADT